LIDPLETLAKLRSDWLTSDGWLLLETPNLYAHDSLELAHLSAFSRHTLSEMVTQAGYQVVWCGSHGKPRSRLLRLVYHAAGASIIPGAPLPTLRPEKMCASRDRPVWLSPDHRAIVPFPGLDTSGVVKAYGVVADDSN